MDKRICVFIGEIAQDYQRLVANSIVKKANSLGYDVVFICNYGSYNEDILHADGEKSCINLPDCSAFDGIIVAEDIFDIDGMPDALYNILLETAKCPVVYLRSVREKFYSIMVDNKGSIESVVRHFTNFHNFKDICFMSGKRGADDASERLNGFLKVMAENNIPVTDHMIFHGDYWRYRGEEALAWFMEGRTTYPQAIICANDYMALSICEALRNRGVRVPEDVAVSGFDLLDEAKYHTPSLTSLQVDFEEMVNMAVTTIDNVNSGKTEEHVQRISAKLRLNKSCGCGKQHEFDDVLNRLSYNQKLTDETKNIFVSVTEYQLAFSFDEFMEVARKYSRFMRSNRVFMCLNDNTESGYDEVENDSQYTNSMALKRIFKNGEDAEFYDIHFKRKDIIPPSFWSKERPNNFCVFPIHFKNIVFGYCVAEITKDMWFNIHTQIYLMTLANAIQNSNLHLEIEKLESIKEIYQNDPLTGILNRRGFDKILKNKYNDAKNEGPQIGISSIDMDNLKTLNDTYGHAEGDKALVTLANALRSVMHEGDYCARIGGDEFAAIITLSSPNRIIEFKHDFALALKAESELSEVKIPVVASVGICRSDEVEATSMFSCIQLADKRMYEDKRSRKGQM